MCSINKEFRKLPQNTRKEPQSVSESIVAVSINEALNKLQKSKEDTIELITKLFKACHDGLKKFKQTALKKFEETHNLKRKAVQTFHIALMTVTTKML